MLFDIKYLSEGKEGCSVLHVGQRLLIRVHPGCEECVVSGKASTSVCTVVWSAIKSSCWPLNTTFLHFDETLYEP